ncbi:MAG: glutamate--tRNA ligase [Nanoarchaeota archaeon]
MNIKKLAEKFALENAVHYNGKANLGSIIAKILGECPELKSTIKEVTKDVSIVVAQVNKLTQEMQLHKLKEIAPELLCKKEGQKKDALKPLPNVKDTVVMRFAPSPSGPLHIGHAFGLVPNAEYAKIYHGVCILRIEDTNPENVELDAYNMIEEDAQWLTGNGIQKIIVQSDRMESYYHVALVLIEEGHAYVCTCPADEFKKLTEDGTPCLCRGKSSKQNLIGWHKMHTGEYVEGSAVIRLKTDIAHKNPAMRDFAILRINESEHPRQAKKYRVWPLMNFSVAVDDYEMGLTHVLRGKDHFDNTKRQKYIFDYMKWAPPEYVHYGRVNFAGLHLSTTQTKAAIKEGRYEGWSDVRIPFLGALRRRGYQAEAIRRFVIGMGISLTDKTVDAHELFKALNYHNKQLVEPLADRYFFVENPIEIEIVQAPPITSEFDLHPTLRKGGRQLNATGRFLLQKQDLEPLSHGQIYRLMECINFIAESYGYRFHSKDVETYRKIGGRIMHWLPVSDENLDIEVIMDDGTIKKGKGESGIKSVQSGAIVQFERHFFARYEGKEENTHRFVYLHK